MNRERLTTAKVVFAVVESYLSKLLSIKKTLWVAVEAKGQQDGSQESLLTRTSTFTFIHTTANTAHQTFRKIFTTQNAQATYFSMFLSVDDITNNLN